MKQAARTYFLIKPQDFSHTHEDWLWEYYMRISSVVELYERGTSLKPLSIFYIQLLSLAIQHWIFDYYFPHFSFFIASTSTPSSVLIYIHTNMYINFRKKPVVLCESIWKCEYSSTCWLSTFWFLTSTWEIYVFPNGFIILIFSNLSNIFSHFTHSYHPPKRNSIENITPRNIFTRSVWILPRVS